IPRTAKPKGKTQNRPMRDRWVHCRASMSAASARRSLAANSAYLPVTMTQTLTAQIPCPDHRADAVAEAVAVAWHWYRRCAERGKDATQFVTSLASLAARFVRTGRGLCGRPRRGRHRLLVGVVGITLSANLMGPGQRERSSCAVGEMRGPEKDRADGHVG